MEWGAKDIQKVVNGETNIFPHLQRFLEKVDGEWKIVYLSTVNTTSYNEEIGEGEEESETED